MIHMTWKSPSSIFSRFLSSNFQMIQTTDPTTSIALSVDGMPAHMGVVPPSLMQIPTDFSSPPPWLRFQAPIYPVVQMDVNVKFALRPPQLLQLIFSLLVTISASSDITALESTIVAYTQSNGKPVAPSSTANVESAADDDESNAPKQSTNAKCASIEWNDTAAAASIATAAAATVGPRERNHLHEQRRRHHGAALKELRRRKFCRKNSSQAQTDESALEQR